MVSDRVVGGGEEKRVLGRGGCGGGWCEVGGLGGGGGEVLEPFSDPLREAPVCEAKG